MGPYMGTIYLYTWPGMDGGTWYAAQYPTGVSRYYSTPEARDERVRAYASTIEDTGGTVGIVELDPTDEVREGCRMLAERFGTTWT